MVAAIYARKSTEQHGVADEAKSVARQIDHARAYALRKGWAVEDVHVYVDDGISGAEFANRPGFLRLMNTLKPRPPFDVIIMSEESRLGREAIETAYALKQLVTAGVRVFFYLEDRERTLETPTDKVLLSLTAFADEQEREKARQRTHDAMRRKAEARHVTGGRVFGYRNVEVRDDHGRRTRVDRQIDDDEANVVRRIFALCAEGTGITRIAKTLNADGAPSPRAQQGRPQAWAPSSVRAILYRPLYRGEIVWNRSKKRNAWGLAKRQARPEEQWIRVPAPELRIVPEELWQAAQARLDEARTSYLRGTNGRLWGRPGQGAESKYLLTGLVRCALCGGTVYVKSRSHGRRRAYFYGCTSYHQRGTSVCSNGLEVPMEVTNRLVLEAFASDILRPEYVDRAIAGLVARLQPGPDVDSRRAALASELKMLECEIQRLTTAVATGGDLEPLVAGLKARDARREAVRRELASLGAGDRLDVRSIEAEAKRRLVDWQELLQAETVKARQVLKKLLAAPLVARPVQGEGRRGWEVTGKGSLGRLVAGLANVAMTVASPTGFEPVFQP